MESDAASNGRVCSKCLIWKGWENFHRDGSSASGFYSRCKVCKGPDKRKHRKIDKAKSVARVLKSRKKYPEKFKAYQKAYREKNKEKIEEQRKVWTEKNREKVRLRVRMCNARRRSNGMRNPVAVVAELMDAQKGKCAVCRTSIKVKFHIDHIMPLALGGENLPRNLQLLCVRCNLTKAHAHPVDFMRSKGLLI